LAPAANDDDDDINGEKAIDSFPRTIVLLPGNYLAALNADGDDYTDEELAFYLKIRRNMERLELEKELGTCPSSEKCHPVHWCIMRVIV
jgi:hypothetical protein